MENTLNPDIGSALFACLLHTGLKYHSRYAAGY